MIQGTHTQQPFASQEVLDALLRQVQGQYLEMPGLSLSLCQAARLFGLEHSICSALLDVLVVTGFLNRTPQHRYVRPVAN